jgi:DNA-binding XRE family transcriptional regulator
MGPKRTAHLWHTSKATIRKRRLDLGLFQEHGAARIGVDETTITSWEGNASSLQFEIFLPSSASGYISLSRAPTATTAAVR